MLHRQFRLKHDRDFNTLFTDGQFVGAPLLTLKLWQIDPSKYPRRNYTLENLKIGFVVSTKVSKSAVVRNRLKRQMREVVRLLLKDGLVKAGYMLAFIAKAEMIGREYKEIERDIINVLRRASILYEKK